MFHLPMLRADRVIFLSKHSYELATFVGLERDRTVWLPPVVDGTRFLEEVPGPMRVSGVEGLRGESFALFVGQMKLRKGWDVLLRAIPMVPRSVLEKFVFVSPSSPEPPPQFLSLVKRLRVEDRVLYLGRLSNRSLGELYRLCNTVVVPSRYEGFGLPVLEAFESGKLVVASDVIELNDVLSHKINAYLVSPKDPVALAGGICEVVSNQELRQRLVEGGKEALEYYRVEKWVPRWVDQYLRVLRSK